jgi:hypothetical protein
VGRLFVNALKIDFRRWRLPKLNIIFLNAGDFGQFTHAPAIVGSLLREPRSVNGPRGKSPF